MNHDKIVNKRAQRIARDHGCVELDELQQAFREKALVDQDVAAGGLLSGWPSAGPRSLEPANWPRGSGDSARTDKANVN